jgi:hypothetical protein
LYTFVLISINKVNPVVSNVFFIIAGQHIISFSGSGNRAYTAVYARQHRTG